jgi:DNA topoisomerase-2
MTETYKKYSQIEHVIARPGMYIGDTKCTTLETWIVDLENNTAVFKECKWNPGIYKIFDEILVNAIDEVQRNKNVKTIKVEISEQVISVYNDSGIPIEIHPEYNIYIPELIFANLLTSSNYDDSVKKTTGGLNGLGAKLTAIFSKTFTVETAKDGKKYTQTFEENLSKIEKPVITKSSKEYTKITFAPDFEKFGVKCISDDTLDILIKRVFDICAITPKTVDVFLNGKKLSIKDFSDYVSVFIGSKKSFPRAIQETERWKVAITPSQGTFQCVSFVNGINTIDGGSHVDHVINPIVKRITEFIQDKNKGLTIKPNYVKENLFVFINCFIENASYSSQTKDKNITKISEFGSKFIASDDFISQILKIGIVDSILSIAEAKEKKTLQKTDGKKTTRVIVPKLDDANKAGTKDSKLCTIIFTEGDSAKATAISGLSVVGRDHYGVFPLRGKLLNTRTATYSQLANNEEINNIKKIIGLQTGKKYKSVSELRYGKILIMTDADTDGFHIKSLLVNFIGHSWPELLKLDFISSLITPVIKVTGKNSIIPFYNISDYNKWKQSNKTNGFKIKYYKGLGTSTTTEAKEYFKEMKTLNYKNTSEEDDHYLNLGFSKSESDARKKWILERIKSSEILDYNDSHVNIKTLINKELSLFSIADNIRSIPNLIDGLKPSQRKVIFSCIKKNLHTEIKVSQLSGYVSEVSSYHHGEASLQDTIVNLSQTFVGSNNMNLLDPIGQFGSRLFGGKDSASPRYIYTKLTDNFKELFNPDDFNLLEYLDDDGFSIEPKFYVPTLPLILINGAKGIGTGFSTDIPCFNPEDIKERLIKLVNDKDYEIEELTPWYKGFIGKIVKVEDNKWTTHGVYSISGNTVTVKELPIGTWTEDYKLYLDKLEIEGTIYSYKNNSTDTSIHFEIKFQLDKLYELQYSNEIEKKLKLVSHISGKNMYVFNENNDIVKMSSAEEILYNFWKIRNDYFLKRQSYLIKKFAEELELVSSRINFINDVIYENIKIFRQPLDFINSQLENKKYPKFEESYKYLTEMKIHVFTEENIKSLTEKQTDLLKKLNKIKNYKLLDFWLENIN